MVTVTTTRGTTTVQYEWIRCPRCAHRLLKGFVLGDMKCHSCRAIIRFDGDSAIIVS